VKEKKAMVEPAHQSLSIAEQCRLIGISRSTIYYKKRHERKENLNLMERIDKLHTDFITWGSRKIRDRLRMEGWKVNRKRVQRLMELMEIQVVYPKPKLTRANPQHPVYQYLLRNLEIERPNQVWCADITYIRLKHGFAYLVAIMDWYSKKILSWQLSNTADRHFCVQALERALRRYERPEISNTDQGAQFTSPEYIGLLKDSGIKISMDAKGRALDNIAIERFWRTLKQDEVYLRDYESLAEARSSIEEFIHHYNQERPHASLGGETPEMAYQGRELRASA
jgi:putative transposase